MVTTIMSVLLKGVVIIVAIVFLPLTLIWLGVRFISAKRRARNRVDLPLEGTLTPNDGTEMLMATNDGTRTLAAQPMAPSGGQAPTAWIMFKSGTRAGQSIPLAPGTTIGRGSDNVIVIEDATVSRQHARISYQDGQFFIEDVGSMSGTLVEGGATTRSVLSSGASLQMGETELVFMQSESPASSGTSVGATGTPRGAGGRSPSPGETVVLSPQSGILAWMAVTAGPQKGKTYQLKAGDNVIGRSPDNDLVIEDTSVSRQHAMIKVQDDQFLLMDLGSRGGTKVGGKLLESKRLGTGGIIGVGQTRLSLVETEHQDSMDPGTMSGATVVVEPGSGSGGVLVVQSGPDAGKSYPLSQGDNMIGRDNDCNVLLTDETVSRRHSLVRREQDQIVVYDLGSRTATQVNGESISGYRLSPGETIALGRSDMVLMQTQPQ
ncbi:MAG: FHA domain-containing protein [Dehalococcoidia bacterium]